MNRGTCIHYTGLRPGSVEPSCAKGVDMRETFDGKAPGIFMRMPCMTLTRSLDDNNKPVYATRDRRGHQEIPCALREFPTDEQIEQSDRDTKRAFDNALLGIKIAGQWRVKPKPAQDRHEVVECPACKGKLHLTQSSYNGHVHGKCETEKCIHWME